jgi:hypothetical protein
MTSVCQGDAAVAVGLAIAKDFLVQRPSLDNKTKVR